MMTSLVCRGSPLQTQNVTKPLLCLGACSPRKVLNPLKSFSLHIYNYRYLLEDHNTSADNGLISVGGAACGGVYSVVIAFDET